MTGMFSAHLPLISLFVVLYCSSVLRLFFFFFFSLISLIAYGPHHYHPACGHKGSSHLSPVHASQFFYRDASSALLQLVNQWLNFTYSRSHAFRYERKQHKSYFGKNRTHDFRTSRCADYLLDHSLSGEYRCLVFAGLGVSYLDQNVPVFISYCERSELLICKVHQFGLGCIKNCAR